jgi:hypothetical protein
LELAKLDLKLQEEELKFNAEIKVAEARIKVLEAFEVQASVHEPVEVSEDFVVIDEYVAHDSEFESETFVGKCQITKVVI